MSWRHFLGELGAGILILVVLFVMSSGFLLELAAHANRVLGG